MKFYAVKKGKVTGIFTTWAECQISVSGFSGAAYKSFASQAEAEAYLADNDIISEQFGEYISNGYVLAFCDGSFDKKQNRYSFGVLAIDNNFNEQCLKGSDNNPKYLASQNIIGEILGALKAMDWAVANGFPKLMIFHDYEGLSKWISGEWAAKSDAAKMYISVFKEKFADILQVSFKKVVGHSHNKYNDQADALAKQALSAQAPNFDYDTNWFTLSNFNRDKLTKIIDNIKKDYVDIQVSLEEDFSKFCYRLILQNVKLILTLYKTGQKKLLIQGKNSLLFQIIITYINEMTDFDLNNIFNSVYKETIEEKRINKIFNEIFPKLPNNYPENIKRLLRQAILNLDPSSYEEDYSQFVFPAFRALEGHMKYLFNTLGVKLPVFKAFNMFKKDKTTNKYIFKSNILVNNVKVKINLENCYNFYNITRNTIFHYGNFLNDRVDSTIIVESKQKSNHLIKQCFDLINSCYS
ncbi:MAG: viroplasmin family protein [Deltaproteobacteria bacterium]|jgi:ribonuclease HI|nr:viroplasmin family protein [Deltaproteobacteria bacterium]